MGLLCSTFLQDCLRKGFCTTKVLYLEQDPICLYMFAGHEDLSVASTRFQTHQASVGFIGQDVE